LNNKYTAGERLSFWYRKVSSIPGGSLSKVNPEPSWRTFEA